MKSVILVVKNVWNKIKRKHVMLCHNHFGSFSFASYVRNRNIKTIGSSIAEGGLFLEKYDARLFDLMTCYCRLAHAILTFCITSLSKKDRNPLLEVMSMLQ